MGPNAIARRRAAELRAELVARHGSLSPAGLVDAALAAEGLEIATFDPGSPSGIIGCDARLDPFRPLVHVSQALDAPRRTFLVAHEIGHHHLHRDPFILDAGEDTDDVAPTVAGRRVAGYSPLSSVEAQANAFADEFLCPSAWSRARMAAGATPAEMAAEARLPIDMVRRQAVHALLPPAPPPRPRRRPELDPEQDACASWDDSPLLVVGASGTGKTALVVERVCKLLARGERPSSILVATATEGGALDLHEDLAALDPRMAGHPWVMCVADVAYEVIVRWPGLVGRDERLRVLDRVGALDLVARALRGEAAGATRPRRLLGEARPRDGRRGRATPVGRAFDDALAKAGTIDAAGLVPLALDVLRASRHVKKDLERRFLHLIVDDVQDLAPADLDLLRALCPVEPSVLVTGDPGQAIEGYRGEVPCAVDGVRSRFHPREFHLGWNYRSRGAVARVVEALGGAPPTPTRRETGASVTLTAARDVRAEAGAIAARIAELRGRGVAYADQAVLTWSNDDLEVLAEALVGEGLPVAHLGEVAVRPEVSQALDFLSFAVDGLDEKFLGAATSAPYRAHEMAARILAVAAGRSDGRGRIAQLLKTAHQVPGIFRGAAARLELLGNHVLSFEKAGLADALVDWVFARDGLLAPLLRGPETTSSQLALVAVHHLLMTCREYQDQGGRDAKGLNRRMSSMGARDQRTHYRRTRLHLLDLDAVTMLTFHAARGLEFEVAHVAGLWAHEGQQGDASPAADQDSVLRVATSRSRSELHMSWPNLRGRKPVRPVQGLEAIGGIVGASVPRSSPATASAGLVGAGRVRVVPRRGSS